MQLTEYLPNIFGNIREFDALEKAVQPEIDSLKSAQESTLSNQFIQTLDEAGCARWEEMLGITSSTAASVEDRRFIIASKIKEELPYTLQSLRHRLDAMLGADSYTLEEFRDTFILRLRIQLTRQYQIAEVMKQLDEIVPCNVILDISLMYTTHEQLTGYTHEDLEPYTHQQIKEGGISEDA